jgi:hypothetical protein
LIEDRLGRAAKRNESFSRGLITKCLSFWVILEYTKAVQMDQLARVEGIIFKIEKYQGA